MDDDLTETERRVAANSAAFRRDLHHFLPHHDGRWVVFHDERAQWFLDDHGAAVRWALDRYGVDGGFAIHQVTSTAADPIHLSRFGSAGAWVVTQQYETLAAAAAAYLDAQEAEDAAGAAYYGPAQAGSTGVDVVAALAALEAARAAVVGAREELERLLGRR